MEATFGTTELPSLDLSLSLGGTSRADIAEFNAFVQQYQNLSRSIETEFFNITGIPGNPNHPGESAPWFRCHNASCQVLIRCDPFLGGGWGDRFCGRRLTAW